MPPSTLMTPSLSQVPFDQFVREIKNMGLSYVQGLFLLLAASIMAVGMAHRPTSPGSDPWNSGFNYTNWPYKNGSSSQHNKPQTPKKIVVGGSDNWRFGFNYTDWAIKNGPFYLNDTLVFKFKAPSKTNPFSHSVYLLPDLWSFLKCDLRRAKMVANVSDGGGQGFKFVLKRWQPYYFACGEHNGIHCDTGMMKFFVMPFFRRFQ